jgi:hypothetical protein
MSNQIFAQQQNVLGFKGSKAELQGVILHYFAGGQKSDKPDREINISPYNTFEMHRMKYPKLNSYIYNEVKFDKNRLLVSSFGSEDMVINVGITQNANNDDWGSAVFSCELAEPISVEFRYDPQNKILTLQYLISEWENEDYFMESAKKIENGISYEQIEKEKPQGIYSVIVIYSVH